MSTNFDILLSENKDFKIVKVKFNTDQKEYVYKTCLDIQVNDLIVVPARDTLEGIAQQQSVLEIAQRLRLLALDEALLKYLLLLEYEASKNGLSAT